MATLSGMRCAVAVLAYSLSLAGLSAEHRIHFKPNYTSTTIAGRFTKDKREQLYVLNARAGQHMRIKIRPVTRELITVGQVKSPSGKYDGGPGGVIFDSDLSETGEYQIRVSERQNNVPGKYLLEVQIR